MSTVNKFTDDHNCTVVSFADKDFHNIKKKNWEVNLHLHLHSDEQYYSSCVGIDIASLKKKEYSVVFLIVNWDSSDIDYKSVETCFKSQ